MKFFTFAVYTLDFLKQYSQVLFLVAISLVAMVWWWSDRIPPHVFFADMHFIAFYDHMVGHLKIILETSSFKNIHSKA